MKIDPQREQKAARIVAAAISPTWLPVSPANVDFGRPRSTY